MMTEYEQAVEQGTHGLTVVSTGICPGCEQCRDEISPNSTMENFEELWETGETESEPFFSHWGCQICGSSLGGNFEVWHAIDKNNEIVHGERACVDCICYLANGNIPETWQ